MEGIKKLMKYRKPVKNDREKLKNQSVTKKDNTDETDNINGLSTGKKNIRQKDTEEKDIEGKAIQEKFTQEKSIHGKKLKKNNIEKKIEKEESISLNSKADSEKDTDKKLTDNKTYNETQADKTITDNDAQTEEEVAESSAIFDSIMSDNRVIAALGGAILLFIGSYLSFWGVKGDVGKISQGNLFTGYMAGGLFGKLCIIAAAIAAVLVCIRIYKAAWYVQLVSAISYVVQVLLIIINGKNVLGSDIIVSIYPGFGSIICLAGVVIMLIFIRKLGNIDIHK